MEHIVANDYSVISRFYKIGENNYEIIATRSTDWNVKSAIDNVKNLKTGKIKEISRVKLYNFTRKI